MRSRSYTLAVALAAGFVALIAGGGSAATPAVSTAALVARYDFDEHMTTVVADESGKGHTMTLMTSNGGALRRVAHGTGRAVEFPLKCSGKKASCPHVVLQSPSSADLNPGVRPLAFGATVRLAPNQTSKGQNVVQKGYSASTSQYKLQVDGRAGRPSCVLVDDKRPVITLVRSSVAIADNDWHTIMCRRTSTAFTIVVDGVTRGALAVSAALSVSNNLPLSIGGKGAYRDNDQFQGAVDDVWVRIG